MFANEEFLKRTDFERRNPFRRGNFAFVPTGLSA
jgi:hypothetical protein